MRVGFDESGIDFWSLEVHPIGKEQYVLTSGPSLYSFATVGFLVSYILAAD